MHGVLSRQQLSSSSLNRWQCSAGGRVCEEKMEFAGCCPSRAMVLIKACHPERGGCRATEKSRELPSCGSRRTRIRHDTSTVGGLVIRCRRLKADSGFSY